MGWVSLNTLQVEKLCLEQRLNTVVHCQVNLKVVVVLRNTWKETTLTVLS